MREEQALEVINSGENTAHELLSEVMPNAASRFYRTAKTLNKLLEEVREHFPDATYYSASGTLCLMIGRSHGDNERAQQELVAHVAPKLNIEGGDW